MPYLLPGVDAVADPRASGLGAALTQWPIIHLGSRQTQETQTEKKEKKSDTSATCCRTNSTGH